VRGCVGALGKAHSSPIEGKGWSQGERSGNVKPDLAVRARDRLPQRVPQQGPILVHGHAQGPDQLLQPHSVCACPAACTLLLLAWPRCSHCLAACTALLLALPCYLHYPAARTALLLALLCCLHCPATCTAPPLALPCSLHFSAACTALLLALPRCSHCPAACTALLLALPCYSHWSISGAASHSCCGC